MKPGTFLWAMEQLIAGKKITRTICQKELDCLDFFVTIDPANSQIVTDEGFSAELSYGDISATDWIIWTPPVNYIPGTFPWAWEQLKEGKKIKRKSLEYLHCLTNKGNYNVRNAKNEEWSLGTVDVPDINATDWEVVE